METFSEGIDGRAPAETGQFRRHHHFDRRHDAVGHRPRRQVPLNAQLLEPQKVNRISCVSGVEQLRHLVAQLECSRLEAHVPSRRYAEDEPKVYVYQLARVIDHNVSIVPILCLQYVGDNCVGRRGFDKTPSSRLETCRPWQAKFVLKYVQESTVRHFAQLSARLSIWNHLDNSTLVSCGNHAVWDQGKGEANLVKLKLDQLNDLKREHILTAVVSNLEDSRLNLGNAAWFTVATLTLFSILTGVL